MAIIDLVKSHMTPDTFAWKYPSDELSTWTQLIVNESQEAVLFKSGKALDVFQSGRYTLDTQNIPLLRTFINLPFGGKSPFTAEVWFVNKVSSLDIKWGTTSPIQLQDPKYGVFVPVRARGQFGIRITDSKRFLIKLVGTLSAFDKTSLTKYFRGLFITKIKDTISGYLVNKKVSILEINAYIDEISDYMKSRIGPVMGEYGISLETLYTEDISVPEDDPAVKRLKESLAKRAEMNIIGYSYQQERSFDTLDSAAANPGSGAANIMGAGIGLGLGAAMGGVFGRQMGEITNAVNVASETDDERCPICNTPIDSDSDVCFNCGHVLRRERSPQAVISCAICGQRLAKNSKFCPSCGKKYLPCPKCGADMPENSTSCPKCGYELPSPCPQCGTAIHDKNAKFCPECGYKLVKICSNCGTILPGTAKFCPECGQKI